MPYAKRRVTNVEGGQWNIVSSYETVISRLGENPAKIIHDNYKEEGDKGSPC